MLTGFDMAKMHTPKRDNVRAKRLQPGLTRSAAMLLFPYRKSMGDCRGFYYSAYTGEARWS